MELDEADEMVSRSLLLFSSRLPSCSLVHVPRSLVHVSLVLLFTRSCVLVHHTTRSRLSVWKFGRLSMRLLLVPNDNVHA